MFCWFGYKYWKVRAKHAFLKTRQCWNSFMLTVFHLHEKAVSKFSCRCSLLKKGATIDGAVSFLFVCFRKCPCCRKSFLDDPSQSVKWRQCCVYWPNPQLWFGPKQVHISFCFFRHNIMIDIWITSSCFNAGILHLVKWNVVALWSADFWLHKSVKTAHTHPVSQWSFP